MINSVLVFMILPLAVGSLLLVISTMRKLSLAVAWVTLSALVIASWLAPRGLILEWMGKPYEIRTSLVLLGRVFTLPPFLFSYCSLVYLSGLIWSVASTVFRVKPNFNAMCLIIPSFLVMMLAVDPFLYSAVIFEILALLAIPLLLDKHTRTTRGVLHYITLQTIAMVLILFSSWMLAGVSTLQISNPMVLRGAALVLLGFLLWFPAFPFHVWMAELFIDHHPWPVSFLLNGFQLTLPVLLLIFLDRFAWLRNLSGVFEGIKLFGLLMIAAAGLFASFQRSFRRQTAYMLLAETGYSLLIIGLSPAGGLNNLALILTPRIVSFAFWSYCLSVLETRYPDANHDLSLLNGFIHEEPLLSLCMVAGQLSLLGFPMLALFPIKRLVWFNIPFSSAREWLLLAIGIVGFLVFLLRMIMAMLKPQDPVTQSPLEKAFLPHPRLALVGLVAGLIFILALGFLPQIFLTRFLELISPFQFVIGSS